MVTKREWLVQKGLAKPGRGKFSKAAHDALAQAVKDGVVFDEPAAPVKSDKAVTVKRSAPKEPTVKVEKSTADPAAVRKWATENGVTVPARGRISEATKLAYEQAMEKQGGEVIQASPAARGEKDVRQHAPLLVPESQVYVSTKDEKPVKGISYKSACADSGVSIGYCGQTTHRVVTNDSTAGLVEVRAL